VARTDGSRRAVCRPPVTSQEGVMPEQETVERAREDAREGKAPSTQAGEFVREEMHHIREGKHGARSPEQAIAIGLSKARRAGVPLEPPGEGTTSERTRESAERAYEIGQGKREPRAPSGKRARAISRALKREGSRAASKAALSRQAKRSARQRQRTPPSPGTAARRGAATRVRTGSPLKQARKAARP
jgi:hypothetical protein